MLKAHENSSRRNLHNVEDNIARLMALIATENKETRDVMSEIKGQCDNNDNLSSSSKQHELENEILQVSVYLN